MVCISIFTDLLVRKLDLNFFPGGWLAGLLSRQIR
jgi:hypothetical protein